MAKSKRKSWSEKMHPPHSWKVEKTDKDFGGIPSGSTLLIATPMIVDSYVRNIPKGSSTNLQQMRKDLAAEYNAEYMCPITAGIFLRIVAEAAYEEMQAGKSVQEVAPFWRMMDSKSPTARKLTFGTGFVVEQRRKEGI